MKYEKHCARLIAARPGRTTAREVSRRRGEGLTGLSRQRLTSASTCVSSVRLQPGHQTSQQRTCQWKREERRTSWLRRHHPPWKQRKQVQRCSRRRPPQGE